MGSCYSTSSTSTQAGRDHDQVVPRTATPAAPSGKKSANPLGLDFSCFGKKSTPIPKTARRGMKPHQFLAIKVFIEKHADESGVLLRWVDWSGAPNHKDSLNLYDLVKYVVNPATAPHKCSFVELMTPEGAEGTATPQWFVSHWWGEPVLDFIKCTEAHARVRELGEGACYWVCAYANNQHELGKDIGIDPQDSSFYQALLLCDGVLVVLDENATPFTRIWCDFEYATVVKMDDAERPGKGRLLLDIATEVRNGSAQVLTEGLAPAEQRMEAKRREEGYGKSGWLAKSEREQGFPIEVVREALKKISVVNAEASKKEDKKHILNSIAGREGSGLDLEPLATHPQYDEVDQTLKSIFAEAAIRKAAAEGESLTEFTKALREGTARKALRFTFSGLKNFSAEDMNAVAEGLPEKLESLTAAFEGCKQLADVSALGAGLEKLVALTSLELNFSRCNQLRAGLQREFSSKDSFLAAVGA